ncbi:MAG: OmpA family protein [Candidatus Eisenbacteria bacterium]
MKRTVLCVLMLIVASSAYAFPPADNPYWDAKAPCYRWPAVDYDGDGVFDRLDRCPGTPKGCTVDEMGCESDSDDDGVCDGVDRCPNTAPGSKVDAEGCADIQRTAMATRTAPAPPKTVEAPPPARPATSKPVSELERRLVSTGSIRLENVYFETNSARLLPESESTLNEAGEVLEKFADLQIEVEGHTDTRGSAAHNLRLSQARSETVRQYLLDRHRLTGSNYVAKGYGETRPETEERNDEELLRNRRVVLRVTNPEVLPRGVEVEKQ